jgi:hypothetical protein
MQLLRDYAATEKGSFLWDWLGRVAASGGNELVYKLVDSTEPEEPEEPTRLETFTVRLRQARSTRNKQRLAVPDDFCANFIDWKQKVLRLVRPED